MKLIRETNIQGTVIEHIEFDPVAYRPIGAPGLEVREVSPDELTDSERRAFGFPVEGGAA